MATKVKTGGLMEFNYKNQKVKPLSKKEKKKISKAFRTGRKRQDEERIAEEERKKRWKRRNYWYKIRLYLIVAIIVLVILFILKKFVL